MTDPFSSIYPSLFQCFVIVILGYLAGRLQVISKEGGAGIAKFVWAFAMPAMLIHSLAVLHLGAVKWDFIWSIVLAKGVIFVAAVLITSALFRGPKMLSFAGMFGIFVTQSNDFALGLPLGE